MSSKLALKRLTATDLTLFRSQYEARSVAKQKAINLNANVFVGEFYPLLPETAIRFGGRFPVDLYVYGPGLEGEYNLQRKIVKPSGAKNWRLNGELIPNPEDSPERFTILRENDIVLLEFSGSTELYPTVVRAVFVAQAVKEDAALYEILSTRLGGSSMVAIDATDLTSLTAGIEINPAHPVLSFGLDAAFEDAALGGALGTELLLQRRGGRRMSRTELRDAREKADNIGRLGEELVDNYLEGRVDAGEIEAYSWDSDLNAIAPFDFAIFSGGQVSTRIDAKSTAGSFDRIVHMSMNEILEMTRGDSEYVIYRLYDVTSSSANLRISDDLRDFARGFLPLLGQLPAGVTADSFSVSPDGLPFSGNPIIITVQSDEDDI